MVLDVLEASSLASQFGGDFAGSENVGLLVGGENGLGTAVVDVEQLGRLSDRHVGENDVFQKKLFDLRSEFGVAGLARVDHVVLFRQLGLAAVRFGLHVGLIKLYTKIESGIRFARVSMRSNVMTL